MISFKRYLAESLPLKKPTVYKEKGFSVILDAFQNLFKHTGNKKGDLCLLQAMLDCVHTQTPILIDRKKVEEKIRNANADDRSFTGLVDSFASGITAKDGKTYSINFSFYDVNTISKLKAGIDKGTPIITLIYWTEYFADLYNAVKHGKTGILHYPTNDKKLLSDTRIELYHALVAVGYDEQQKVIICKGQEKTDIFKGYIKIDEKFFFNAALAKNNADPIKKCLAVKIDSYDII